MPAAIAIVRSASALPPKAWLAARQAASIQGPKKGLGRLKAYKHLPVLKAVLAAHAGKHALSKNIERRAKAA